MDTDVCHCIHSAFSSFATVHCTSKKEEISRVSLFFFSQFVNVEWTPLGNNNVHNADDRLSVLAPVVNRYLDEDTPGSFGVTQRSSSRNACLSGR